MVFTEREQRTIQAVFGELLRMRYSELNKFLGSLTIEEMQAIYRKLYHEPYCTKHGIKLEDMTEDDFLREYEEKCEQERIESEEWECSEEWEY